MSTTINAPTTEVDTTAAGDSAGAPTEAALTAASQGGTVGEADGAPEFAPPTESAIAGTDAVAAAVWHRDVRITATWSNAATRNAYAAVSGLGWRRISPANDSCFVTMTALLAHAEAGGRRTDLKLDGSTIVEVYVF